MERDLARVGVGGTLLFASAILACRFTVPTYVGAEAKASCAACVGMCLYGTRGLGSSCAAAAFLYSSAAPLAFLSLEKNFIVKRSVDVE
jgi:hypothetical protein